MKLLKVKGKVKEVKIMNERETEKLIAKLAGEAEDRSYWNAIDRYLDQVEEWQEDAIWEMLCNGEFVNW